MTLSAPTNGATLADGSATGTIVNDDAFVSGGTPFINEFHYDNSGTDAGEAIEIAGPAGTNLTGWTLVLYNGTNTPGAAPVYGDHQPRAAPSPTRTTATARSSFAVAGPPERRPGRLRPGRRHRPCRPVPVLRGRDDRRPRHAGRRHHQHRRRRLRGAGARRRPVAAADRLGRQLWRLHLGSRPRRPDFGAVNAGQNFIAGNATGLVSIADAQVAEGDSGTTQLIAHRPSRRRARPGRRASTGR